MRCEQDYSKIPGWVWPVAFLLSVTANILLGLSAARYTPDVREPDRRFEVRMIKPEPPPVIELPPPPPPPPPQPKAPTKPPKTVPRPAPLPVLAAPPAPAAPVAEERVVPVQPAPAPLPPIDAVPPPSLPPAAVQAPSAPAPSPPVENIEALISGFGREVSRGFEANKRYPRVAQTRGQQGRLELLFDFDEGRMVKVSVKQSSGHNVLDEAALEAARKMKLPDLSGTLAQRRFSFTLPVEFKLQ